MQRGQRARGRRRAGGRDRVAVRHALREAGRQQQVGVAQAAGQEGRAQRRRLRQRVAIPDGRRPSPAARWRGSTGPACPGRRARPPPAPARPRRAARSAPAGSGGPGRAARPVSAWRRRAGAARSRSARRRPWDLPLRMQRIGDAPISRARQLALQRVQPQGTRIFVAGGQARKTLAASSASRAITPTVSSVGASGPRLARQASRRGLQADQAAGRGRHADRAGGVRAQRGRAQAGRHRDRRAAGRAADRRRAVQRFIRAGACGFSAVAPQACSATMASAPRFSAPCPASRRSTAAAGRGVPVARGPPRRGACRPVSKASLCASGTPASSRPRRRGRCGANS